MYRLIEEIVRSGLVTAWRFASCPTSRSPVLVNATTEGVVRDPSELAMTVGLCPSITATTELVVPRSIPTTLAMKLCVSLSEPRGPAGGTCVRRALPLTAAQGWWTEPPRRTTPAYHTCSQAGCSTHAV